MTPAPYRCQYILRGKTETCGRKCRMEGYCCFHRRSIKNGFPNYTCSVCGIRVKGHYCLCKAHGANVLGHHLIYENEKDYIKQYVLRPGRIVMPLPQLNAHIDLLTVWHLKFCNIDSPFQEIRHSPNAGLMIEAVASSVPPIPSQKKTTVQDDYLDQVRVS